MERWWKMEEDGGDPPNAQNFVRIGDIMIPLALLMLMLQIKNLEI
jgi:uncharacterized protein YkuJ